MCSDGRRSKAALGRFLGTTVVMLVLVASNRGAEPRFFSDDPLWVDPDTALDAGGAREINLSEGMDFLENTFGAPGSHERIRALNINTLDEVPDSSWFTNRIGRRPMSISEIVRGPDRVDTLEIEEWLITGGKGPPGFQPGFRAVDGRADGPVRSRELYQLELDTRPYPELATGSEMIGTLLYHAIGYNVVDTYLVNVDPKKVRIDEDATNRDASGRRRFRAV